MYKNYSEWQCQIARGSGQYIQMDTIQYNTIQYNTIQYNTIQYNTIQYNTIQYNTIKLYFPDRGIHFAVFVIKI